MELHNILNLAKRLRGRGGDRPGSPRYPRILAEIDDSYFRRFGEGQRPRPARTHLRGCRRTGIGKEAMTDVIGSRPPPPSSPAG